jgi:site-specific DNA recombinase
VRLLPYVRLSIETDETTSPERQLDKIQTLAKLGDHELVPITEADYDLNVSGSVSPFDRPGLGRPPHPLASRFCELDRLARRTRQGAGLH